MTTQLLDASRSDFTAWAKLNRDGTVNVHVVESGGRGVSIINVPVRQPEQPATPARPGRKYNNSITGG